ncbi:MAG: hypothetical protein AAGI37_15345 [Planctomycetota bacterium]
MEPRGFIDVLFILLCGAIVLLSQSLPLGELDAAPTRVGGGGVSAISADAAVIVVVDDDRVWLEDGTPTDERLLPSQLAADAFPLLVPAAEGVSHHRVLAVWDTLRHAGVTAGFGVVPDDSGSFSQPISAE